MTKKSKKLSATEVLFQETVTDVTLPEEQAPEVAPEPRVLPDLRASTSLTTTAAEEFEEAMAEAEIEQQIKLSNSVVKSSYKIKYRDRARANGIRGKAAKRSAWDWLAQELAAATLTKDAKLKVEAFLDILEANGVAYNHWLYEEDGTPKMTKGWEGRLRMTGRLALQRVVAETGVLKFSADPEDYKEAPAEWVAKFLS